MPYTTKEMPIAMHFRSHAPRFLALAILAGSALLSTFASAASASTLTPDTYIQSTTSDGSVVTTADSHVWSIEALDRIDTGLWLPVDNITYLADTRARCTGPNAIILLNTDESRPTGEQACATLLS
jgi:hypothetical protein